MSQTTHLTVRGAPAAITRASRPAPAAGRPAPFHREVGGLEAELPVQRAHAQVAGVHLAGELARTRPGRTPAARRPCSSSATSLRSGTSAMASERKLPYLAPVRELVRPDSQAQPTGDRGRPGGHGHQRDLARLAQRARDPLAVQRRVVDGLVAERDPGDLDLEPGDRVQVVFGGRADQVPPGPAWRRRSSRAAAASGGSTVPPQSGQPAAFSAAILGHRAPGPTSCTAPQPAHR